MHSNTVTLPLMKAEAVAETETQRIDMSAELADYRDALLAS